MTMIGQYILTGRLVFPQQ